MKEIKKDHEIELKNENWSVTKGLAERHYKQKGQQVQSLPMGKSLVGQVTSTHGGRPCRLRGEYILFSEQEKPLVHFKQGNQHVQIYIFIVSFWLLNGE